MYFDFLRDKFEVKNRVKRIIIIRKKNDKNYVFSMLTAMYYGNRYANWKKVM